MLISSFSPLLLFLLNTILLEVSPQAASESQPLFVRPTDPQSLRGELFNLIVSSKSSIYSAPALDNLAEQGERGEGERGEEVEERRRCARMCFAACCLNVLRDLLLECRGFAA